METPFKFYPIAVFSHEVFDSTNAPEPPVCWSDTLAPPGGGIDVTGPVFCAVLWIVDSTEGQGPSDGGAVRLDAVAQGRSQDCGGLQHVEETRCAGGAANPLPLLA